MRRSSFPLTGFFLRHHHAAMLSTSQGHSEGSARGQREAEADAEEPASLLLGPAPGAGRGAPLDEEGGAPCRHQCEGERRRQWHPKRSEVESMVTSAVCVCV